MIMKKVYILAELITPGGGGVYCLMWAKKGCAAQHGQLFNIKSGME